MCCASTATSPPGTSATSPPSSAPSSTLPPSPRSTPPPAPDRLPLRSPGGPPRGRSGRALTAWIARDAVRDSGEPSTWRRIPLGRGLELHVDAAHPLARVGPGDASLAEALRQVITKLLPHTPA